MEYAVLYKQFVSSFVEFGLLVFENMSNTRLTDEVTDRQMDNGQQRSENVNMARTLGSGELKNKTYHQTL